MHLLVIIAKFLSIKMSVLKFISPKQAVPDMTAKGSY